MCFKKVYDSALKTALRFNHSLEEILEHADVKEKWEKCSQTDDQPSGTSENQLGNSAAPGGSAVALVAGNQDHPLADKIVSSPVSLSETDEQLVTAAEQQVMTTINSLLSTVNFAKPPERGETTESTHSVTSLATALRSLPVIGALGSTDSSVLLLYDVESAGEQAQCPRRSGCPIRKDHLATVVSAALIARSDHTDMTQAAQSMADGEAEALAPDQSDVSLGIILFFVTCACRCFNA